jgi:hypothetical protein
MAKRPAQLLVALSRQVEMLGLPLCAVASALCAARRQISNDV